MGASSAFPDLPTSVSTLIAGAGKPSPGCARVNRGRTARSRDVDLAADVQHARDPPDEALEQRLVDVLGDAPRQRDLAVVDVDLDRVPVEPQRPDDDVVVDLPCDLV